MPSRRHKYTNELCALQLIFGLGSAWTISACVRWSCARKLMTAPLIASSQARVMSAKFRPRALMSNFRPLHFSRYEHTQLRPKRLDNSYLVGQIIFDHVVKSTE